MLAFDGMGKMISSLSAAKRDIIFRWGLYGFYIVSLVIGEAGLLGSICSHYEYGWLTVSTGVAIAFCLVSVVLFVRLENNYSHSGFIDKPEKLFLLVAPIVLIGFAMFMMPFAVPDEFTHINRVFDNRAGIEFVQVPSQLPEVYSWISDYSALSSELATDYDYSVVRESDSSASAYSEINYLIPSIVVAVGRVFDANGLVLIFAARLSNAAVYFGAAYWMLRRLPAGKTFALVFLLNPMLLQQEASCSADALCNVGVLCFLTQVVAMRLDTRKSLPVKDWLSLLGFLLVILACKYVYLPLALAAVVLYPKIKRRWIRLALPFVMLAFAAVAIVLIVSVGYGALLARVLEHFDPMEFWAKLVETIVCRSGLIVWQFAGGNLGWPLDDPVVDAMVFVPGIWMIYLVLLCVSFLACLNGKMVLALPERFFFVILAFAECLLIYTALWSDNPEIAGPVTGVQGRYLFGPLFLASLALLPSKRARTGLLPAWWFVVGGFALNALSLAFVIAWFW